MSSYVCINDSVLRVGCIGLFLLENQVSLRLVYYAPCLQTVFFRTADPGAPKGRTI